MPSVTVTLCEDSVLLRRLSSLQKMRTAYSQLFCEFFGVANVKYLIITEPNKGNIIQQLFCVAESRMPVLLL